MYFKDNLRFLRKKEGHSQENLAQLCGYKSFTTIQKWEDGTSVPSMKTLHKLSELYHIDLNHLMMDLLNESHITKVAPVLGVVQGGSGVYAEENILDYENLAFDEVAGKDYFYLDVVGDSMINARILPHDRLYIHSQNKVENGEIAIVLLENNEATVKRIFFKEDKMILQPENENYQPRIYSLQEVEEKGIRIIGKVLHNKIKY